jgi:hypothetical protein
MATCFLSTELGDDAVGIVVFDYEVGHSAMGCLKRNSECSARHAWSIRDDGQCGRVGVRGAACRVDG